MKHSLILFATFTLLQAAYGIRQVLPTKAQIEAFENRAKAYTNRVINGQDATPGLAPYQISLQGMYGGHMCGGVIIDENWILTAAHCVYGYNPPYLRVHTGSIYLDKLDTVYHVEEYWVHCNYNFPELHNDIALMKLNDSIKWNEHTQPIALPTKPLQDGDTLLLTGWGSTILWGDAPDTLQQVNLTYSNYENCQALTGGDERNGVGHICTLTDKGQSACHGDSGGPLVKDGYLYGLVNWGMPCALGYPDSHCNVYYYLDWIKRTQTERCKNCYCYASNYPY